MDAKSLLKWAARRASVGASGIAFVVSLVGCDESKAEGQKAAEVPASDALTATDKEAAPAVADAASTNPVVAAASSYKEESFHLSLVAPSTVSAGKPAIFQVILEAQSGFKINDEYPVKFQFDDAEGVSPEKKIARKEDAKVEKMRAEFPLSVTINQPGKRQVSGRISFSVCTDERCLIEKRDLSVSVTAS